MSKNYRVASLILFQGILVVTVAGCNSTPSDSAQGPSDGGDGLGSVTAPRAAGVGTISMQRLLTELGLSQQAAHLRDTLQQKIASLEQEKQARLDKKRKEFPEKPSDEQARELQKLARESDDLIRRTRDQNDRQMKEMNDFVINILRQKTSAPIQAIARKRGLAVVLLQPQSGLVYQVDEADITDEVLDAIRISSPGGLTVPPLPATIGQRTSDGLGGQGTGVPKAAPELPKGSKSPAAKQSGGKKN